MLSKKIFKKEYIKRFFFFSCFQAIFIEIKSEKNNLKVNTEAKREF